MNVLILNKNLIDKLHAAGEAAYIKYLDVFDDNTHVMRYIDEVAISIARKVLEDSGSFNNLFDLNKASDYVYRGAYKTYAKNSK